MMSFRAKYRTDDRGAVAIVVAVMISALLVTGGIVLDFGLVRMDRQISRTAADDAVAAGLRAGDGATGEVYSYRAVCEELRYLRVNRDDLSGRPDGIFTSEDASQTCTPGDPVITYHGLTPT